MTEIYFGTNRNSKPKDNPTNFGKRFSDNGLSDLRFGKAVVSGNKVTVTTHGEKLVQRAGTNLTDDGKSQFGSHKLFDAMRSKMRQGNSVRPRCAVSPWTSAS